MFRCGFTTSDVFHHLHLLAERLVGPKGKLSQRAARILDKPVPRSGGLQTAFKGFKAMLHFFFLCKDQGRIFCHVHPCSRWPGDWLPVLCLFFSHGPALLLLCASSCLPSNKQRCVQPTHGEGGRFATHTPAPPGIQDQDRDLKRSKCICCGANAVLACAPQAARVGY